MNLFRVILCLLSGLCVAHAAAPNVLLICVDDLKPLLGCYGDRTVRSPNIDRFAASAMLFERAYCNQAVCAPSRNALMTGMRPTSLGIYDLGTNFRFAASNAVTLSQYFMRHDYRAEALGKIFHVGHGNHDDPASWSVPHWHAKVVAYALSTNRGRNELSREEALFENVPDEKARRLPRGPAYEAADVPDSAYPDGQIADEAIRRLRAAKGHAAPFFLAVGFVKPHLPFCAPKRYWDLYDPSVFKLAERKRAPVLVHMRARGGTNYGAEDAQLFLDKLVTVAPSIEIVVAHLGASGPGYSSQHDSVMAAFGAAVERNDPRMRNVYFDVSSNVTAEITPADRELVAKRIRQVGVKRILYGSDLTPPGVTIRSGWDIFRTHVPLTAAEFRTIAGNVTRFAR